MDLTLQLRGDVTFDVRDNDKKCLHPSLVYLEQRSNCPKDKSHSLVEENSHSPAHL